MIMRHSSPLGTSRLRPLGIALALGLLVAPASAQSPAQPPTQTPPEEDPQLTDPSWRETPEAPAPPTDPAADDPGAETRPDSGAAATAPDYRIRPAPLLPEGSFLPRRRGTLVRSGSGEWVYIFHPDERGEAERPMTLLPSATLERMEDVQSRRRDRPQFILTGQVFVYGNSNYLLPTAFSMAPPPSASPSPAPGEAPATGAGGEAELGAGEAPGEDPDRAGVGAEEGAEAAAGPEPPRAGDLDAAVEDLIERIESERPGARALGESSMLADVTRAGERAGPDSAARPRPDGDLLVRRRGRLTRQAGAWRYTIDNDSDGASKFQTSMVLLPSLNLQRMEVLAADRGENQPFEISGLITQYRGRNYLVPTIYRVIPQDDGVRPLQ